MPSIRIPSIAQIKKELSSVIKESTGDESPASIIEQTMYNMEMVGMFPARLQVWTIYNNEFRKTAHEKKMWEV